MYEFSVFYFLEREKCVCATSFWGQHVAAQCLFVALLSSKSHKFKRTSQIPEWAWSPKCKFLMLLQHQIIYIFSNVFIPVFVTWNACYPPLLLYCIYRSLWLKTDCFSSSCTTKKSAGGRNRAIGATTFKSCIQLL